jgi:hypothetical protein
VVVPDARAVPPDAVARPLGRSAPQGVSAGTRSAVIGVRIRKLVLATVVALLGCRGPRPTDPALPLDEHEVNALRLRRLDQAAARLGVPEIPVALSHRREPGAWAWPGGPILVGDALVDLLDDDELTAAVAHELGHLQADGSWRGPSSALEGADDPDAEARADALGCRLLALRGIPPAASVRLLEKLGAAFAGRAARARAACGPLPASAPRP